jgi:hypothetical protein
LGSQLNPLPLFRVGSRERATKSQLSATWLCETLKWVSPRDLGARQRISCAWSWSGGGMANWMVVCVIEYMSNAGRDAYLIYNGQWLLGWSICCNLNLGLITKARAYKGASQKWSLRVTFHAHGSLGECEGMNRHTPKCAPILGIRVPMDSRIFKGQL